MLINCLCFLAFVLIDHHLFLCVLFCSLYGWGWGVLKQQHKSRSFCLSSGDGGEGGVGRYIWAGITMLQIYSSILAFLHKMWRFCTQSKSWKVCMCIVLPVPVLSVNILHPTKMMKSLHVHCFAGAYLRTGLMIWRRCFRQDEPQPFWRKNTWRFTKICWRFL